MDARLAEGAVDEVGDGIADDGSNDGASETGACELGPLIGSEKGAADGEAAKEVEVGIDSENLGDGASEAGSCELDPLSESDEDAAEELAHGLTLPAVEVHAAKNHGSRIDFLCRGDREPLASMGPYHYAMFVRTVTQNPVSYTADDYVVYRFSPLHPQASRRVQFLRVDEPFMVPRLFGLTLSPPRGPAPRNPSAGELLFAFR